MSLITRSRERAARMKLRTKLTLAFLALTLIGGLSGVVGVAYIQSISRTLNVYSAITSPLVLESAALVDDAQRMNTAYQGAIAALKPADVAKADIARSNLDALERIDRLGITIQAWEKENNVRAVQMSQTALSQTRYARALAQAIDRNRIAEADDRAVDAMLRDIQTAQREIDNRLLRLIGSAEARMTAGRDRLRQDLAGDRGADEQNLRQLAENLDNTFPMLQAFNALLHESARLRDATSSYDRCETPDRLTAIEAAIRTSLSNGEAMISRGEKRLHDPAGLAEVAQLRQAWQSLAALYQAPEGLLAGKLRSLQARQRYQQAHIASQDLKDVAFGVAARVDKIVRMLNEQARETAVSRAADAVGLFGILTLITCLGSILLGRRTARGLLRPLDSLTERANLVGNTAGAVMPPDPATGLRRDEFGLLSRAFDAMLVDLAAAREQLVSETRAILREQVERMDAALEHMSQGLSMYDANQRLIIANPRMAEIYGYDPSDLTPGVSLYDTLALRARQGNYTGDPETYIAERIAHVASGEPWAMIDELVDGRVISVISKPLASGGCVVTHEDITEHRTHQARIAHMAYHDGLTGLPNRTRFNEALAGALAGLSPGATVTALCLDLDRFKSVNDTLGHPVGDTLLQNVGDRLRACVGEDDLVARLGGDEFAIIQAEGAQPMAAQALAERIIACVSEPYDIGEHHIVVGTSIGIAIAPEDGIEPEEILKHADMALYRAKADGRGTARFYESQMDEKMQIRRQLEIELRAAVHEEAFEIHYQPLVNLASNRVSGFEALLRWKTPQRGPVSPAEFIPILEEVGLIGQVGAWVLKTACQEAARWPGGQKIAVNLSALQFKQRPIALDVAQALMASGLRPDRLELEITESVLLQDTTDTLAILKDLRQLGVRISMDDFGTGYSSLSYLRSFPFDKIKIDQSFVRDMEQTDDSIAIIRAVTGLGVSLGMSTTAEGVETEAQLSHLRKEGCTEVQGYFLSRPKPPNEIAGMIASIEATLNGMAA